MKTLILLMIIFFVFKMLGEAVRKQTPRQDLPEYRPPPDDAPLPGPWNRRAETGTGSPLPGPRDILAEPGDDAPLPGPWERRPRREQPVEPQMESRRETGFKSEPAYEPGRPEREKRRETQPAAGACDRVDEPVMIPEPRRSMEMGASIAGRGVCSGPAPGENEAGRVRDSKTAAVSEPVRRKRKRRRRAGNPLSAVLGCRTTLVGGMVLGQVLGTRGGRAAERRAYWMSDAGRR